LDGALIIAHFTNKNLICLSAAEKSTEVVIDAVDVLASATENLTDKMNKRYTSCE